MNEPRSIPKDAVVALLSSALGQEKGDEVVLAAARSLGIPGATWTGAEVRLVVDALAKAEGLVGVVARFALSRGDVDRLVATSHAGAAFEEGAPSSMRVQAALAAHDARASAPAASPHGAATHDASELVALLSPALGAEKSRDAVEAVASRLALDPRRLTREHALAVLDELTKNDGIVGVVARFAKARFLLVTG